MKLWTKLLSLFGIAAVTAMSQAKDMAPAYIAQMDETIQGTVKDSVTHTNIAGIRVELLKNTNTLGIKYTRADGTYLFSSGDFKGKYSLIFSDVDGTNHGEYTGSTNSINFTDDKTRVIVNVDLIKK